MNLMIVGGMSVLCSFWMSLFMLTVSKALLMSSATTIVRAGGGFELKPCVIALLILCSAVVVECFVLKPC